MASPQQGSGRVGDSDREWTIQWVEEYSFKFEQQEGTGVTDDSIVEWAEWMDVQLRSKYGPTENARPMLIALVLDFSSTRVTDAVVTTVMEYMARRRIGVHKLKFSKNSVGDWGAKAIGDFVVQSDEPVRGVYLSHNRVTELGALYLLLIVARSGKYPFPCQRYAQNDPAGNVPAWLHLEHNRINWGSVEESLARFGVQWSAAGSRDGWNAEVGAPSICIHQSYRLQTLDGPPSFEALWVSLRQSMPKSKPPKPKPKPPSLSEDRADHFTERGGEKAKDIVPGDSPLYVFVDASALLRMASRVAEPFSMRSLLNLCRQGHMKCKPPAGTPVPPWMGSVEERDRIVLVITGAVFQDLRELVDSSGAGRDERMLEWLQNAPESYLSLAHHFGIMEIVDTARFPTELVHVCDHIPLAEELQLSGSDLMCLDFACWWELDIPTERRVIYVTNKKVVTDFVDECVRGGDSSLCRLAVVQLESLNRSFTANTDRDGIGRRLSEAALLRRPPEKYCGAVLCAQVLYALLIRSLAASGRAPRNAVEVGLRQELHDGREILDALATLMRPEQSQEATIGAQQLLELSSKMRQAALRWHMLETSIAAD